MIPFICQYFGIEFKLLSVLNYYSTRIALSAITCLLLSIVAGSKFIRKLYKLKIGQPIPKDDCHKIDVLHAKKRNTPTMGGVVVLSSMLLSMFLWMNLNHQFTFLLFLTTMVLGILGICDDCKKMKNPHGVSAKKKIFIQTLLAIFIAAFLVYPEFFNFFKSTAVNENANGIKCAETCSIFTKLYFPFFKFPVDISKVVSLFLIWFVIVGSSNAVNITDGLDGLAMGNLVMVSATLSVVAFLSNNVEISNYLNILYIEGSGEVAIYLAALAGGGIGLLWYNGYPAQVFIGDTGSLSLGGIVGLCAVLLRREFFLGIVGGVFVIETLSVILQVVYFKSFKKRLFLCSPLHHHFECRGIHEMKIVLRFWILGLLLAIVGLISLKFQ